MLTLLANLKGYLWAGVGIIYFITFVWFESELAIVKYERNGYKKQVEEIKKTIIENNTAIDKMQKDAYARELKLKETLNKIAINRKESQKTTDDIMEIKIPPGCENAMKMLIDNASMGKP